MKWPQLTREQEHARLMREYGNASFVACMSMLERQFSVLHNRSQLLLTLCGIIITTTGFSGRAIAHTRAGQILIVVGVGLVLAAAVVVAWRVLHLHWITAQAGDDRAAWLMRSLEYRDCKTFGYRLGLMLVTLGLAFYAVAIGLMLLYP